jgi:octaprenyl-diphosphate synthase
MNSLNKIKSPIYQDLTEFEEKFSSSMKSEISLLNIVTNYLLKRKGKQIRPILVFLSAKLVGEVNKSTHVAAMLMEIVHTATLVHDDVIDDANERRGFLSINALWRSKIAVLLGDYLLSKSLQIAVENKEFAIMEITNNSVQQVIKGELQQIQKTRKLNITESEYFSIIEKKTATLLAACTGSGARSVTEDRNIVDKLKDFGMNIGIAFQIKDDLFDYEENSKTGKPKGNDIQEKKLTLPLIHALDNATKSEKRKIIRLINKKSSKKDTFKQIYEFVHSNHGDSYARSKMMEFKEKSLSILEDFSDSDAKNSLTDLVNYIVERKK